MGDFHNQHLFLFMWILIEGLALSSLHEHLGITEESASGVFWGQSLCWGFEWEEWCKYFFKIYARFSIFSWGDSQSLIVPNAALPPKRVRTYLLDCELFKGRDFYLQIASILRCFAYIPSHQPVNGKKTGKLYSNTLPSPFMTGWLFQTLWALVFLSVKWV